MLGATGSGRVVFFLLPWLRRLPPGEDSPTAACTTLHYNPIWCLEYIVLLHISIQKLDSFLRATTMRSQLLLMYVWHTYSTFERQCK